jgi:hypothetical protein
VPSGHRAIAPSRQRATAELPRAHSMDRWADEPMSPLWGPCFAKIIVFHVRFPPKRPLDFRPFLQKWCQPGTKARIIIGHCVSRSFVFIYISGSTFSFNIFWGSPTFRTLVSMLVTATIVPVHFRLFTRHYLPKLV